MLAAEVDFPLFEFRTQRLFACFEFGLLLGECLTLFQRIGCLAKLRFLIGLGQTPLLFFRFQCRQPRCKLLSLRDKLLLLQCELFLMAAEVVFPLFELRTQRLLACFKIGLLLGERLLQLGQVVLAFGVCRFALGNFVSLSGEFTSLVVQFPFVLLKFGRLLRSLRFPGSLLPFELLLFRVQSIEVGRQFCLFAFPLVAFCFPSFALASNCSFSELSSASSLDNWLEELDSAAARRSSC